MGKFYFPEEEVSLEAENTEDAEAKLQEHKKQKEKPVKKNKIITEENNG